MWCLINANTLQLPKESFGANDQDEMSDNGE
jgi:hypothetical protein